MARPLRIQFPGACYHITSRGNERKNIFLNKSDRERFLAYLKSSYQRYGAIIHVYCLMSNHYHIFLETPRGNLSQIMRHVNGAYTTYFNLKHKRSGHLFQGRYKAILVEVDAYAVELSRYIHLNPVRAEVVDVPVKYNWSSYKFYIGKKNIPDWLTTEFVLNYFGSNIPSSQKRYVDFVSARIYGKYDSPLDKTIASTILGTDDFIEMINNEYLQYKKSDRNLPALKELTKNPEIDEIYYKIKSILGDDLSLTKKIALYICHRHSGRALKEIGIYFGISEPAVSLASSRLQSRLEKDMKLRKIIANLCLKLKLLNV